MQKKELLVKVGGNIRLIRESKGLTQMDVAAKMEGNIDTSNISRIEQGRTNPTILTLYRISKALGVPLSQLVDIVDQHE
ncbi:MAG: helix-turn-helix domain-containing protein [Fermentimonas sp.]